jgi:hypothetical protein
MESGQVNPGLRYRPDPGTGLDERDTSAQKRLGTLSSPNWLTLASNKCQLNDSRVVAVLALSCHRPVLCGYGLNAYAIFWTSLIFSTSLISSLASQLPTGPWLDCRHR